VNLKAKSTSLWARVGYGFHLAGFVVFIYKSIKKEKKMGKRNFSNYKKRKKGKQHTRIKVTTIHGLDELFAEIEKYCYTSSIVTITNSLGETFQFDLNRQGEKIKYGYHPGHEALIRARVLRMLTEGGRAGFIVRSFLEGKHPETGFPYKELRGYLVWIENNAIKFEALSAREVMEAHTTDASTGEPIPAEKEVIFCGPDGKLVWEGQVTEEPVLH
jgi:hypothetical protein